MVLRFKQGTARRAVPSWTAPLCWDPLATGFPLTPPRNAFDEARANALYTEAPVAVSKRIRLTGHGGRIFFTVCGGLGGYRYASGVSVLLLLLFVAVTCGGCTA